MIANSTEASSLLRRQTLGDLLRRSAKRWPHKVAIHCGETSWTYAQFDAICDRLAAGLSMRGIGRGDRVAILSRNSHAFAAMRFALARIGAVLVPVNFMLKASEAAYILGHAEAKLLCVDSEFAELGRQAFEIAGLSGGFVWLPGEVPTAPPPHILSFDQILADHDAPYDVELHGELLAQIIYTSGTESLPKGAMLTHHAIIWEYVSIVLEGEIVPEDRLLHALPLFHCAQLDAFLGPGIYLGTCNVITAKPTAENILRLIEEHQISSFFAPPTVWIAMLGSELFDPARLSSLLKGYYGASPMPVEVQLELQRRLPNVRFWNMYGQTEMAPAATVLYPHEQLLKPGSAGRAMLNVEMRVVDEQGNDVEPGQIGEIVFRSPQLLTGYYKNDERTRQAFEGGWFHSGDLGVLDGDGYVTIVDRKKDMIKSGGENVASREVEEMIYRLAEVAEVAVIGTPHPKWIEAVTAIVVVKRGHELSEHRVIEHCHANMAHFKVPKRVAFMDSLPKNPTGKVLKRELRLKYSAAYS